MMYELFHACQSNNIKKITEILDRGIDVNCVDFDTGTHDRTHRALAHTHTHAHTRTRALTRTRTHARAHTHTH
jgi:hypothetical protein